MKRLILTSVLAVFSLGFFSSCSDEQQDEFDCVIEATKVDIHHQEDDVNPLHITFDLEYIGSGALLNEIAWDYGDGTQETINGLNAAHTYSEPGDYTVKASVAIQDGDNICLIEAEEDVTAVEP